LVNSPIIKVYYAVYIVPRSGPRRLLIVAGYGGHAGYAYSIAWHLASMGYRESVILVAKGYEHLIDKFKGLGDVKTLTLPRKPGEPIYKGLHRWVKSALESISLASKLRIGAVFTGGSNFSIPPAIASKAVWKSSVYTLEAIEHFTKRSRAVVALEKLGARVFLHWDEQLELFPRGVVVGPVYEPRIYEPRNEGYVLVTTGTLGFKELFDAISALNLERVVLQTGDVDPRAYIKKHSSWTVFRYTSDIHKWIAGADLVITQQGMTAATAALAYGKPVVIAYNPRVVLGAPRRDVEIYASKLGANYVDKVDANTLKTALERVEKPRQVYRSGAEIVAKTLLEHVKTY
jgi:UDP-N-acetylglucosamine:LPS N-acetylglucosamine transferase